MNRRKYLLAAFLVLGCAAEIEAQREPDVVRVSQAQTPVIKSETRAVAVDVVVTRDVNEPVKGLHQQDFVLMEDGKPQVVDFFQEHDAPVNAAIGPLPAMPPHVYTNVPAAPAADAVNVLLLDMLNTPQADQSYVREEIMNFLRTMQPDARIAIFGLSNKLSLIQGFTDDPALLRAAILDKKTGFRPGTTDVSRSRGDDDDDKKYIAARQANLGGQGRTTAGIETLTSVLAQIKNVEADQRIAMTLDALQKLGRYLSGIPGRKNLIWFASQYPVYLFPDSREKQPHVYMRPQDSEIKQTVDVLTLSKVAVYPIDAEAMMNDHPMDPEHNLEQAGFGGGLLANIMNGASERAAKISAMEQIAIDTGGEAIFNNNDLNASLNRVIHLGAHYYTLIYTPSNKKMNGDFRRIDVKMNAGKFKLAYRRGYYATDAPVKLDAKSTSKTANAEEVDPRIQRLRAMLGLGMASATEVLYGVRVLPAAKPASGERTGMNRAMNGPSTRYAVDFLLDPKKVALVSDGADAHRGWIRIELVVYDRDGKALNWNGVTLKTNLDAATYASVEKSGIPAHIEIDVPDGGFSLATGICDLEAGKVGTLEVPLADTSQASVSKP